MVNEITQSQILLQLSVEELPLSPKAKTSCALGPCPFYYYYYFFLLMLLSFLDHCYQHAHICSFSILNYLLGSHIPSGHKSISFLPSQTVDTVCTSSSQILSSTCSNQASFWPHTLLKWLQSRS